MKRVRLDTLLAERRLAPSPARARALILAGRVAVNGRVVPKAGAAVSRDASIEVRPARPYVSRGGIKLAHALDVFKIATAGRTALDIGASTGGFTDVLLSRGAAHVVSLDVSHGQIDWQLRNDPRVTVIERVNARNLTADLLPRGLRSFDLVAVDVSFISLRLILPVVPALLAPAADVVALVKPQFEAGRAEVGRKGIVRDASVQQRVLDEIAAAADAIGLTRVATAESPIRGAEGNREFFLHLRARHP